MGVLAHTIEHRGAAMTSPHQSRAVQLTIDTARVFLRLLGRVSLNCGRRLTTSPGFSGDRG